MADSGSLTPAEFATRTGISRQLVFHLLHRDKVIKYVMEPSEKLMIPRAELDKYLRRKRKRLKKKGDHG